MFFAVIATYLVATAFAFCGIVRTVGYIKEAQPGMGSYVFIDGLTLAMWPLAVAMALVMLVQIACQLERWKLLWTMAQSTTPASSPKAAASAHSPKPTPPAAAPKAAPAVAADAAIAITPPVVRTPAAAPEPPKDASPTAPPASPAPAGKAEGLNFFKLD